uniref:Reverse transcriptase domain-containing protein n=1 Tax=Tanacetum cinerariifolium TaxID=118510 RepID=A0A699I8L0_TANCI|nr:reverse transcriptase domain-containing protein [Tanacetum cinerariifolium]
MDDWAEIYMDSPAEEEETESNVGEDGSVNINPFCGGKPMYRDRHFSPHRNDLTVDRGNIYRDDPIRSMGLKIENPEFKEEVINEFDKLRMRYDVVKEEEQVVAWFLGVLKPEIADIASSTSHFTPPTRTVPRTAPKATTTTTSAAGNTKERVNNAPLCYKCSGIGHYARDCLNMKTLAFVPDDADSIYDIYAEPDLDELGDELVYPDRGEALVIQRLLNVVDLKSVDDNSWLRNNIFRTKCTFKRKIYDMIINGGSCENVVSTYMVEKLGMNIEDHLEPLGHYVRDCLNMKTLTFVPDDADPIYDTDAEADLDEPGDELVYPDHEEALVIQRLLNVIDSKLVDDNYPAIATRTVPRTTPKATTTTTSATGNSRKRVNNAPLCYKCSRLGHYARDYLNMKTLAFVPDDADPIYDTDAEPDLDEPSDELVYPDRQKALVIQRLLNVVDSKSVDDNSCENVVSTYMVEKLRMKIEDHPEPYQLTWLKKGTLLKFGYDMKVNGRQVSKLEMDCTSGRLCLLHSLIRQQS